MKSKDIETAGIQILAEIENTKKQIEEYKELTQPVEPDCAVGRVSRMDAINNKAVYEHALRKAENKLKNLNYVLSQIHSKEFGICAKCKTAIPLQRIIVMPHSRFCVKCAGNQ